MTIVAVITPGARMEPTRASMRRGAEVDQDAGKVEAILDDTWGHMRAEPGRFYTGHILFAMTCNREITVLDWEFEDLCGGPWFPEHLMEFIESKVPTNLEEFRLWRFDGTYRATKNDRYRFSGKVRPMRVQYRFPATAKAPAKAPAKIRAKLAKAA